MWAKLGLWIVGHSWREIAAAIAVLAIGIGSAYFIVHERNIGFDECEAQHAKRDVEAQAKADQVAQRRIAELRAEVERMNQALPVYLQVYGDKSKPADCAPVKYERKMP